MKIESVTALKNQTNRILSELRTSKEPALITEHDQPMAYLVDVKEYELMQSRTSLLEGLARGETALSEGRVISNAKARKRLEKWLKEIDRFTKPST